MLHLKNITEKPSFRPHLNEDFYSHTVLHRYSLSRVILSLQVGSEKTDPLSIIIPMWVIFYHGHPVD